MTIEQQKLTAADCERVYAEISQKLDNLSNSTLLVTGGSGFMGCWIGEMVHHMNQVHGKGVRLCVLARDRERFAARLPHVASAGWMEFIRCDVRNMADIPREVNYVIHAAGTPDNRFHSSNPVETMTTTAEGTSAVLRAANRASDLRNFVYVSSSSVYASNQAVDGKIPEGSQGLPLGPQVRNAFSEARRYGEMLCAAARSEAKMPVVTIRPFTFCGAYQELDSPWAINNFINDALHNRTIRVLGDGRTVRSYMYGADLAAWLLVMVVNAKSGATYNVGSDTGFSLGDIANKVAGKFSPSPDVALNSSLTGGPVPVTTLVPDTSAAARDLGLGLYTDIDEAISRTIEWHKVGR